MSTKRTSDGGDRDSYIRSRLRERRDHLTDELFNSLAKLDRKRQRLIDSYNDSISALQMSLDSTQRSALRRYTQPLKWNCGREENTEPFGIFDEGNGDLVTVDRYQIRTWSQHSYGLWKNKNASPQDYDHDSDGKEVPDSDEEEETKQDDRDERGEEKWQIMFQRAKKSKEKSGNFVIDKTNNGSLWYWLYTQRKMYRENRLPRHREEQLTKIGYNLNESPKAKNKPGVNRPMRTATTSKVDSSSSSDEEEEE
ncbi:hypothetical protein PROFUN_14363 [Planoprotostelium fungivorum]|uniref:Helicase-associated domain-containing protein n=1 Tax=Planoprotostelium fungivorum TaxID=1890364 RepID=A0A2P6N0D6_9EUKA|nr:hypothetical protein PROFUN_14363 [Planoprotostelium fungivorum]